jgi:predicted O-methyltransferase YrrM
MTRAAFAAALLPQLVALDIEPYMAEFAGPYFAASGLAGRIRPMIGPAQDSMLRLAEQGERCGDLTEPATCDNLCSLRGPV